MAPGAGARASPERRRRAPRSRAQRRVRARGAAVDKVTRRESPRALRVWRSTDTILGSCPGVSSLYSVAAVFAFVACNNKFLTMIIKNHLSLAVQLSFWFPLSSAVIRLSSLKILQSSRICVFVSGKYCPHTFDRLSCYAPKVDLPVLPGHYERQVPTRTTSTASPDSPNAFFFLSIFLSIFLSSREKESLSLSLSKHANNRTLFKQKFNEIVNGRASYPIHKAVVSFSDTARCLLKTTQ